jgi:transcription initiation factor TFIIIB Brf1 subunit/transcription initiation factor TFIIB
MKEIEKEMVMMYDEVLKGAKQPMSQDEIIEYLVIHCYDLNITINILTEAINQIKKAILPFATVKEYIKISDDDLPF